MISRHMFAAIPDDRPSVRAAYEAWLSSQTPLGIARPEANERVDPRGLRVGIVGGGMAGLYSAMILRLLGAEVHVFEADPTRLGGRVYTHRFTNERNQYFEAGAMRLPEIPEQEPVFGLIEYLNANLPEASRINTIPYVLYDDGGDLVQINGTRQQDGRPMTVAYADAHPDELGFSSEATDGGQTANALIQQAIGPYLALLQKNFEEGFAEIVKYDDFSFRAYLSQVLRWSEDRINYVETMTSQTNQFQNSFTELVIENMDFSQANWKSIENGMDRLPRGCAELIGDENITLGAPVTRVEDQGDEVVVYHGASNEPARFDKVILAVPPAALRMIETPTWSPPKTHAVRALHFEPLYKIGARFQTRFWEKVARPARGGQSITDLPSRWIVYPSYGIGDDGPGVLLLYAWMTDAVAFLPQSEEDRVRLALRDLQTLYGNEVDVASQFLEAWSINWTVEESTGDAMFFPGQFKSLFNVARQPEGNLYFAGEHLSVHHTWIVGALDSGLLACQQLLGDPDVRPIRLGEGLAPHGYDYSEVEGCKALPGPAAPGHPAPAAGEPPRWYFES